MPRNAAPTSSIDSSERTRSRAPAATPSPNRGATSDVNFSSSCAVDTGFSGLPTGKSLARVSVLPSANMNVTRVGHAPGYFAVRSSATTTLVRAPLIVVAMSFQSYLIVFYRDHPHQRGRVMLVLQACTVLGGALLGLLAWWLAAPVFELLFAGQPAPDGAFAAVLVFSSGLVAALCVTSPALLARGDHMAYTVGWAVGALATVGAMLLPLDLLPRVLVALCTGPVLGLVVELGYLLLSPGRGVVDSSPPSSPPSI